jgi:hypothetical protein
VQQNPFESLAKGIDKNPSLVFEEDSIASSSIVVPVALTNGALPRLTVRHTSHPNLMREPLSDRFIEPIVAFPLAKRVVINQYGAFVPQSIFGAQTQITFEEERSLDGTIRITIHPTIETRSKVGIPQFGSARGLITIPEDFDDALDDFADYM